MTVRFKNELVRNITIKLGYANAKVRLPQSSFTKYSKTHDAGDRYTNVRTKPARDQAVTAPTPQAKKTTHPANDPDAGIE